MVKMVVLNSTIRSTILKEIAREIKEERSAIQDTIGFATHRKTQLGREEPSDENAAAIQSLEKQIELLQEQLSQLSSAREETLQPVELTTVGLADSNGNVTVLSEDSQAYADQTIQSRQTLTLCVINTKVLEENPKSPPWRKLIFQRHNSTY